MNNAKCACRRGRPKAMSDAERRSLIKAEAEQLFLEKGYAGASTDELAARCRMSKRTLYRLFPGKSAMCAAVVESDRLRMIDIAEDDYADLPMDEALARVFMIDLDQEAYESRAALLRVTQVECAVNPELRATLHREGAEVALEELTAWLDRQSSARGLRIRNTRNAAHMLMDMFTAAVVFDATGCIGWASPEERLAHFRQCIDVFLHGVAPVPEVGA